MTWGELLAAANAAGVQPKDKIGFLEVYFRGDEPKASDLDVHRDDAGYVSISMRWQSGTVHGHDFKDASIKPMGKKVETCGFCGFEMLKHHPDCTEYKTP